MRYIAILALCILFAIPVALGSQESRHPSPSHSSTKFSSTFRDLTFLEKTTLAAAYLTQRSGGENRSIAYIYDFKTLADIKDADQVSTLCAAIRNGKVFVTRAAETGSGHVYSINDDIQLAMMRAARASDRNPLLKLKAPEFGAQKDWVMISTANLLAGARSRDVVLNLIPINPDPQPAPKLMNVSYHP